MKKLWWLVLLVQSGAYGVSGFDITKTFNAGARELRVNPVLMHIPSKQSPDSHEGDSAVSDAQSKSNPGARTRVRQPAAETPPPTRPTLCHGEGHNFKPILAEPTRSLKGQIVPVLVKMDADGKPLLATEKDRHAVCLRSFFQPDGNFGGPLTPYTREFPFIHIIPGSACGNPDMTAYAYLGEDMGLVPMVCKVDQTTKIAVSTRISADGNPAEFKTWEFRKKTWIEGPVRPASDVAAVTGEPEFASIKRSFGP